MQPDLRQQEEVRGQVPHQPMEQTLARFSPAQRRVRRQEPPTGMFALK